MSDEWDGLLDPDEHIIWQGAPDPGLRLAWKNIAEPIIGVVFLVVAANGFDLEQAPGWTNLILPALFALVGLYQLFLIHPWKAHLRKNTFYSLSNKRAFIGTSLPFRSRTLESYPISPDTTVTLTDGTRANIHFAERIKPGRRTDKVIPIGFEDLTEARNVYSLIRRVQDGNA